MDHYYSHCYGCGKNWMSFGKCNLCIPCIRAMRKKEREALELAQRAIETTASQSPKGTEVEGEV